MKLDYDTGEGGKNEGKNGELDFLFCPFFSAFIKLWFSHSSCKMELESNDAWRCIGFTFILFTRMCTMVLYLRGPGTQNKDWWCRIHIRQMLFILFSTLFIPLALLISPSLSFSFLSAIRLPCSLSLKSMFSTKWWQRT